MSSGASGSRGDCKGPPRGVASNSATVVIDPKLPAAHCTAERLIIAEIGRPTIDQEAVSRSSRIRKTGPWTLYLNCPKLGVR